MLIILAFTSSRYNCFIINNHFTDNFYFRIITSLKCNV